MNKRVRVRSGDGETDLGEGTYVGNVKVYFYMGETEDGEPCILSAGDAQHPPPENEIPMGFQLVSFPDNPKIVLDTGEVVYGCQVWWEPIDE